MADPAYLRAILNHLGYIHPQPHWGIANHIHEDFHELIVILKGVLEAEIRGELIRGGRGDILYYPRGEWHTEYAVGEAPLETFFLAWQWRGPEISKHWPLHIPDRSGRVQMLMHWLRELFPPTTSDHQHSVNVLLDAMLFEVERSIKTREAVMVAQVKTFIQHHLSEPISLDRLADVVGLSKYHFCREFKKAASITPMNFVRQVRVEAARSLLLSTPWTLKAIAQQVGFADEFHLSRVFRRVTDVSPSQIRPK